MNFDIISLLTVHCDFDARIIFRWTNARYHENSSQDP